MTNTYIGLLFLASYLLGGIPTGYIIGRIKGIDIRQHGSGNPGTANVYRTLGKWPGILTFTVDFLKGFAPAMIAKYFFYIEASADFSRGHWWIPVTAGAFVVFGAAVAITHHISVGSMSAAIALPALCYFLATGPQRPFTLLALVVCVLIIYTHISNIRRILKGAELSFKHRGAGGPGEKTK